MNKVTFWMYYKLIQIPMFDSKWSMTIGLRSIFIWYIIKLNITYHSAVNVNVSKYTREKKKRSSKCWFILISLIARKFTQIEINDENRWIDFIQNMLNYMMRKKEKDTDR